MKLFYKPLQRHNNNVVNCLVKSLVKFSRHITLGINNFLNKRD